MATEEEPIKIYFVINILVVVIIVVSAGYAYQKFFADRSEENEEATNIEKEKPDSRTVSERVSKGAFLVALFLAVILIVVYLMTQLSRRERSRF